MLNTKQKIADAAETLIAEHGFEAATTRMISKLSGVNIAMINYYFGSKENLLESIVHNRLQVFADKITELTGMNTGHYERMCAIAEFYVERLGAEPHRNRIISRVLTAEERPELAAKAAEMITINRQKVAELIKSGMESGVFKQGDAEMVTMAFYSIIYQFSNGPYYSNCLMGLPLLTPVPFDEAFKQRLSLFLKQMITGLLLNTHSETAHNVYV